VFKQTAFLGFALLISVSAGATGTLGSFHYTSASQLQKTPMDVPSMESVVLDRVDKMHMLIQCGEDSLYGYAKSEAQYKEAVAYWTSILKAAGIQVGTPSIDGEFFKIPYTSPDGKVVRRFLADPKQFKPKDEISLRANMSTISNAIGSSGMKILLSNVVNVEYILPTYVVYYLTDKHENRDRELQIRILKRGTDIDWDIVEGVVNIVQKPKTWMMVYIGREIGQVSLIAKTQEEIMKKLAARKKFLVENGNSMIGSRIGTFERDDQYEDYRYYSVLYFFR